MKKSLLNEAVKTARLKLLKHPEFACYPHYSFIVQDNRIVEWATNARHEVPRYYGYHHLHDDAFRPKYHAELFAYKRARGLLHDGQFQVINLRLSKGGLIKMSRPCKSCINLMRVFGCNKFYYSSEAGFMTLTI